MPHKCKYFPSSKSFHIRVLFEIKDIDETQQVLNYYCLIVVVVLEAAAKNYIVLVS